jgi:hypothetical protein
MHAPLYIPLEADQLRHARRALRETLGGQAGSAHIAEAFAFALGFRTHAALLADLDKQGQKPRWRQLDEQAFRERLSSLTKNVIDRGPSGYLFDSVPWSEASGIIETDSPGFHTLAYKSLRARAWRNMMVLALNEGLDRGLFTMVPDDNRWPGVDRTDDKHRRQDQSYVYDFEVGAIPAVAQIGDGGHDELRVFIALWPTDEARRLVGVVGAGFRAGEAVADGWVERRDGAYLQTADRPSLSCRRQRVQQVADIEVEPHCYADRGSFRL